MGKGEKQGPEGEEPVASLRSSGPACVRGTAAPSKQRNCTIKCGLECGGDLEGAREQVVRPVKRHSQDLGLVLAGDKKMRSDTEEVKPTQLVVDWMWERGGTRNFLELVLRKDQTTPSGLCPVATAVRGE